MVDSPEGKQLPAWRTCLDFDSQDAGHYLDFVNEALYHGIGGEPGRVLELGCSSGVFGQALKDRHPGTHVTAVEAGRAAAALAATRLDKVVHARIEDLDFSQFAPASFDLVVAGDVLEHLYNPWGTLERVRPLIAPGGRLVASIPNARNLDIITSLAMAGRFEYAERGLLDITHLRFFTLDDIRVMLDSTGFELDAFLYTLASRYEQLFRDNEGKDKVTLQLGRMTLSDLTQRELMEFCTETYVVRARPRP